MSSVESEKANSLPEHSDKNRDSETMETSVSCGEDSHDKNELNKDTTDEVGSDNETSSDLENVKVASKMEQPACQEKPVTPDVEQPACQEKTVMLDVEGLASTSKESPKQEGPLMQEINVIEDPIYERFRLNRGVSRLDGPNKPEKLFPHIITLILHIFDIITPFTAAVIYFVDGHSVYGSLTLITLGITLILTNCLSLYYFRQANSHQGRRSSSEVHESLFWRQELRVLYHTDRAWFVAFVIFHMLQFGLLFRILRALHRIRQRQFSNIYEMNELIHNLRLLESFLGSSTQASLQMCILIRTRNHDGTYAISVITAIALLFSVVWVTRLHYGRFLKNRLKDHYPWFTETALLLSPLLTLSARFLGFALFTSYYTWMLIIFLLVHLFVTVVETIYSSIRLHAPVEFKNSIMNCAVAIYIYLARERSLFGKFPWIYDIFILIENTGLFLAWYIIASGSDSLYYGLPLASVVWGGYIIGVTLKLSLFDNKRLSKYITL